MPQIVVIFRTQSQIEADVVKGLLDTHGIPAIVTSGQARTTFPFSLTDIRVSVDSEQATQASRIIESHRRRCRPFRLPDFPPSLQTHPCQASRPVSYSRCHRSTAVRRSGTESALVARE